MRSIFGCRGLLLMALLLSAAGGAVAQDGRPDRRRPPERRDQDRGRRHSIEQAVSDRAQLNTIAFSALAFLTGNLGCDTFLPPGKVSDFFGFQYMRDNDAGQMGHNTSFVSRIADNVLHVLNDEQKALLVSLGEEQAGQIEEFARKRFPLIKAFRRQLEGDMPKGSKGLDKNAVMKHSAGLYEMDGLLAWRRAEVLGRVIKSLDEQQKAYLNKLSFGDSRTWPELPSQIDRRGMPHGVRVSVMTYASEMFSWHAGSVEADTYFCPERHGMYFGAFYMKGAPAMGKRDYSISTRLTGESGERFLEILSVPQRALITRLVDIQRRNLDEIVKTRRAISTELRRFMKTAEADRNAVVSLSRKYGELDGEIAYYYATHFAEVNKTLSDEQKAKLMRLRNLDDYPCRGAYLYSRPIAMPDIPNTDSLFGAP